MFEKEAPQFNCRFLDGTDGYSCNYQGSYRWTRNKPSLSRRAVGPIQQWGGDIQGPHLRCKPAEIAFTRRDTEQEVSYEELVRQQSECSKFEEAF